jgi:hypothetical protein
MAPRNPGDKAMSNTNTGGPAFPVQSVYIEDQATNSHGMTLRDYFAAKAMQGICASGPTNEWSNSRLAAEAYDLANAMLKAREA